MDCEVMTGHRLQGCVPQCCSKDLPVNDSGQDLASMSNIGARTRYTLARSKMIGPEHDRDSGAHYQDVKLEEALEPLEFQVPQVPNWSASAPLLVLIQNILLHSKAY